MTIIKKGIDIQKMTENPEYCLEWDEGGGGGGGCTLYHCAADNGGCPYRYI